jgi:acetyl-CoA acetyltransferase
VREAVIVGVGVTEQRRNARQSAIELCIEAARSALGDAGLAMPDVDGVQARWDEPSFTGHSLDWITLFRHKVRWIGDTYPQGVPGILDAAAAIRAGLCDTVLLVGGQVLGSDRSGGPGYTRPTAEFASTFGSFNAAQFALVANRYYHLFRPNPLHLAGVAAAIRNMGAANPAAVMAGRGPYSPEDILESPMVVEPFRLLDLCLVNDGAAAVIVTTLDRARDSQNAPVRILGGASEWWRRSYIDWPRYEEVGRMGSVLAADVLSRAGLSVQDLDVLELYDVNTFEVVRQLEVLGYCGEGEGAAFAEERGIGVTSLPINTDGGLLSFSHIGWSGPTLRVIEAVRQLRGEASDRQIAGARHAVVTGGGSGAQYFNMAVLGRG